MSQKWSGNLSQSHTGYGEIGVYSARSAICRTRAETRDKCVLCVFDKCRRKTSVLVPRRACSRGTVIDSICADAICAVPSILSDNDTDPLQSERERIVAMSVRARMLQ